ncbi:MAG: hypothetical protein WA173_14110 [Pseudomonas sp.]|uniref:hypothetical protein n=1 Tax=Pseudomonas sp. TaxID=306 RepID=UPI003BB6BA83
MNKSLLTVSSIAILLSGCTNLTSPAREHSLDPAKNYWFDYDASRRGAVMIPGNSEMKICSEPSPDVALNLVSKIETSIEKTEIGKAEGSAEFNTAIVKLAERTQMVMFLRESLYRLCEQSLNQKFTPAEVITAYSNVIATAAKIAEADRLKAEATAANALGALSEERFKALRLQ